jgi:BirA family biotin operon repressor/biotin-[acetyl-CoA-carboxylase] ligase
MPGITLMTAVCLAEAFMETCGLEISIKWPNDIHVRGRKLSGILTEMVMAGGTLDYIIVGVGINLSHGEDDFPEEIRCSATSIMMETGSCPGQTPVIKAFLERFERAYQVFVDRGVESIVQRWSDLSGMIGRHVLVESAGPALDGTISGIDDEGALIVRCTDGCERSILSGHITLLE